MSNRSLASRALSRVSRHYSRLSLRGTTVECQCCGWLGRKFWRGTTCPRCGSSERHRFFALIFARYRPEFAGKSLLEFAPSVCLKSVLHRNVAKRTTADIAHGRGDLTLDICNMNVPSESYDVVMAFHVLEHVSDDQMAIAEMHRVLKPHGCAFLCVPITVKTTQEIGPGSPAALKSLAGYPAHVRACGTDYSERLSRAGFKVTTLDPWTLPESERNKFGIAPPSAIDGAIYVCHK